MAKNTQLTFDDIWGKYDEYLHSEKSNISEVSIPTYEREAKNFFMKSSFCKKELSNLEGNFLDLLPSLICSNPTSDLEYNNETTKFKGDNVKGCFIINDICKGIEEKFFSTENDKTKTEQNIQSYVKKFLEFIKEVCSEESKVWNKEYTSPKLTPAQNAVLTGNCGEIYLYSQLCTKFKSRLRCQDRTSGDKIWLPLRFIGKTYSQYTKKWNKEHPKDKITNLFSEWLDNLLRGIFVHYQDKNGKICSTDFSDAIALRIHDGAVYVWKADNGDPLPALTPTGKGNEKVPMENVKSISEIDIDHVKSIDQTLRDLDSKNLLPTLKKVSDKYKKIQEEDEPNEEIAIDELLADGLELDKLRSELDKISSDGLLRLMDSKYNSKKSNGDTFQRIIKDGEKYYGILEEGIFSQNGDIEKEKEETFTLYQDLHEKGIMRIKSGKIKGVEVKGKEELEKIIDLI